MGDRASNWGMGRRVTNLLAPLLLALVPLACGDDSNDTETAPPAEETPTSEVPDRAALDIADLVERTFVSVGVSEDDEDRPLVDGTEIELSFPDGDTIAWTAGCNQFSAEVQVSDDSFDVGSAQGTLIGCEPEYQEQDDWLNEIQVAGPAAELDGDELTLSSEGSVIDLVDESTRGEAGDDDAAEDEAADGGGGQLEEPTDTGPAPEPAVDVEGTIWQLHSLIDGDEANPVPDEVDATVVFEDGRVGTDVCNVGGASARVGDGEVTISEPLVMTRMACGPPLDEIEQQVVAVLEGTLSYEQFEDQLMLHHSSGSGLGLTARDG